MAAPKKSSSKSGSTSASKTSTTSGTTSSAGSASSAKPKSTAASKAKAVPAKAREAASKAAAKVPKPKGKGKVIAASAGVAAAAVAAGVAYFRGTRGSSASGEGRAVYHVQPAKEGWQVKGNGSDRAVSNHSTKKEALTAGRELAHSKVPSQLVVHKSDGSVQESWTYDSE